MPRGRRDSNEPEIVSLYGAMGHDVFKLEDRDKAGLLDLLIIGMIACPECGRLVEQGRLVEVKTDKGQPTAKQVEVLSRHPTAARLVRNVMQAIEAVGRQGQPISRESRNVAQAGGNR